MGGVSFTSTPVTEAISSSFGEVTLADISVAILVLTLLEDSSPKLEKELAAMTFEACFQLPSPWWSAFPPLPAAAAFKIVILIK